MTPRLIAFYEGADYARMARVLAATAAEHCPHWDRRIVETTLFSPHERSVNARVRHSNSKLKQWAEAVDAAPDGTPMALIDADVMILRSLDDLWERSFDVAYTIRDPRRTPLPLNAGIVFVRATAAARRFLWAWYQRTVPIRTTPVLRDRARKRYGACDQAGLVELLASSEVAGIELLKLPCQEWNCEDSEWGRFDPARTRVVHIKGALREAIFGRHVSPARKAQVAPLVVQWRAVERAVSA